MIATVQIISDAIRERLKQDLGSETLRIGDVSVEVKRGDRADYGRYSYAENYFRIHIKAPLFYDLRGVYLKAVRVYPDAADGWMRDNYLPTLEKVKAAIAKIQAKCDELRGIEQESKQREIEQEKNTLAFIKNSGMKEVLKPSHQYSLKEWQGRNERVYFNLRNDNTFEISRCYASLSLDQVKRILAIVEEGK